MAPSKQPIQPDIRPQHERKPPDPMDGHDPMTSAGPQIRSENEQCRASPDPSAGSGVRVLCASEAGASRGLECMGSQEVDSLGILRKIESVYTSGDANGRWREVAMVLMDEGP